MMNFYSSSNHDSNIFEIPQQIRTQTFQKVEKPVKIPDVEQLYQARDRLREFIQEIGTLRYEGIRVDILNHCYKLKVNLSQHLTHDKVMKLVKNRIDKMIKNKRIKKNWSQQDVLILIWVVSKYCDMKQITCIQKDLTIQDWKYISQLIPGVEGQSCMFKWLSLRKNNLSDNNWSEKQSNLLNDLVKMIGENNWPLVSQKLYYINNCQNKIYRCPKQCRQHWNCYLNPNLKKGPWSKEEDQILLRNVLKNNGQKKWAQIVKIFNGRTQNALKNRFTLIMQKQAKAHAKGAQKSEVQLIHEYLQRIYVQQFVNIQTQKQCESPPDINKNKWPKKQQIKQPLRTSLRRRHSTRTLGQRKDYLYDDEESLDKILKQQNLNSVQKQIHHSIYYPQNEIQPIVEQQYSQPCKFIKLQNEIFQQDENQANQADIRKQNNLETLKDFPECLDGIQMIPFDPNLIKMANMTFVPCVLDENKLSKIQ